MNLPGPRIHQRCARRYFARALLYCVSKIITSPKVIPFRFIVLFVGIVLPVCLVTNIFLALNFRERNASWNIRKQVGLALSSFPVLPSVYSKTSALGYLHSVSVLYTIPTASLPTLYASCFRLSHKVRCRWCGSHLSGRGFHPLICHALTGRTEWESGRVGRSFTSTEQPVSMSDLGGRNLL